MPPSNRQEIKEYQKYLLSQGNSPQEVGEYGDYLVSQLPDSAIDSAAKTGVDLVGRALSVPGGVVRAATLSPLAKLSGDKETSVLKDMISSVTGKGPMTAEYLSRMGVGDLGSIRLPDWLTRVRRYDPENELPAYSVKGPSEITGKQAIGIAGDITSDIVGTKGLAKLAKSSGESLFKRGFKREDAILASENKKPISDIMWRRGETPLTPSGKQESLERVLGNATAERKAIEEPLLSMRGEGSMQRALQPAQNYTSATGAERVAESKKLARKLQGRINAQMALGERPEIPATPSKTISNQVQVGVDEWTGNPVFETKETVIPGRPAVPRVPGPTYKDLIDLKQSASDNVNWKAGIPKAEDNFYKALGGGAREESYRVAESLKPGSAAQIAAKNEEISTLLSMLPDAERKAIIAAGKNDITQIDAILAVTRPDLYVSKNLARLAQTGGYTAGGRGLYNVGRAAEKVVPYSPWATIYRKGNQ